MTDEPSDEDNLRAYYHSPDGIGLFLRDVLQVKPAPYQDEVLRKLVIRKRVCVRSPHGAGKTALAAWAALWCITTAPGNTKVPTTATSWQQLTKYLWPEIRRWAMKADWSRLGIKIRNNKELLHQSINYDDRQAFGLASNDHVNIEGAHASTLMFIFDEAKAIPTPTFDAIEGAFSSAGDDTGDTAYALAISTPGDPVGRFYDIQSRKAGYEDWWVRAITMEEAVAHGRMSKEWVEQRKRQWGEKSAVYINRVLGNFASSTEDSVIPLSWIEAAHERWYKWVEDGKPGAFFGLGVDVGRGGDASCFAPRYGNAIDEITANTDKDTMIVTGEAVRLLRKHGGKTAHVDVVGIGSGVVDRLREQNYNVYAFNAGAGAKNAWGKPLTDLSGENTFADMRSYAWWNMREMLDPANDFEVALPPIELLTGDLASAKWRPTSGGRIKVEEKAQIRKRLSRSTDYADAVIQIFCPAIVGAPEWEMEYG